MNIETKLRESLQEKGKEITPPPGLKMNVLTSIHLGKSKTKKRIITGVLAASLLIPTGAFASKSLIADGLYGSFDNLKKHITSATMEGYLRLDAKIAQAQGQIEPEEYKEFIGLVKIMTDAKLEFGDKYGGINYADLSPAKQAELEKVYSDIQPYYDLLNGQESSKDLLTEKEYKHYIESLMVYEEIIASSQINPDHYIETKEIPTDLQAPFEEARDFIDYVNEKQTEYRN
ncbi:DUF3600 domain-containing protein [Niallia circulans]|uniref:DUF3600 domain-containing protein n=1 Tax=Niallia circulans TaxID=1397 RepID=A0A553STC8_NIACI|nr:DUF3600 domain-containing protein [Niallia circulans]TRZ40211.1 DUF3600 domain-containing protein [Niallia circulans]